MSGLGLSSCLRHARSFITDSDLEINCKTTSINHRLLSMIYYQCLRRTATSRPLSRELTKRKHCKVH